MLTLERVRGRSEPPGDVARPDEGRERARSSRPGGQGRVHLRGLGRQPGLRRRDEKTRGGPAAFYTVGGMSFGLLAGAEAAELVIVVRTERGVTRLLARVPSSAAISASRRGRSARASARLDHRRPRRRCRARRGSTRHVAERIGADRAGQADEVWTTSTPATPSHPAEPGRPGRQRVPDSLTDRRPASVRRRLRGGQTPGPRGPDAAVEPVVAEEPGREEGREPVEP